MFLAEAVKASERKLGQGFVCFQRIDTVDSSASKKFSTVAKIMFRVSGDFYNIRTL